MMRRAAAVVLAFYCSLASLSADLKYSMTIASRPSSVSVPPPANPLLGLLGPMLVNAIAPPDGVNVAAIVGERGARLEYDKAYMMVPAGGVLLLAADGGVTVLNPAERTYWKASKPAGVPMPDARPSVKVDRTGAFETIAGVRSERATVDLRMKVPLPEGAQMPGLPSEISGSGEVWLADQYKKYAAMLPSLTSIFGAVGPDPMASAGFPMKSIMRSELFGSQEIESLVTSIAEVTAPAGAFDIPEGYKEVPPPVMNLPGMGVPR